MATVCACGKGWWPSPLQMKMVLITCAPHTWEQYMTYIIHDSQHKIWKCWNVEMGEHFAENKPLCLLFVFSLSFCVPWLLNVSQATHWLLSSPFPPPLLCSFLFSPSSCSFLLPGVYIGYRSSLYRKGGGGGGGEKESCFSKLGLRSCDGTMCENYVLVGLSRVTDGLWALYTFYSSLLSHCVC